MPPTAGPIVQPIFIACRSRAKALARIVGDEKNEIITAFAGLTSSTKVANY
jgi:hypothetical protein